MTDPGTQVGTVHHQREGTGLAHILTGDGAVDTYGRIWAVERAARAKRDADAAAKRDAAIKGLKEFAPEYSYRYVKEIQPRIDGHIQEGADLLAKGIDPFTSTDAAATAWQKNHQSILADAAHSMQTEKEIAALTQDIDGKDPSEYTADSWQANLDWVKMPLAEKRTAGAKPPLVKKRAWTDASEWVGKNMKIYDDGHAGADPRQVEDFVTNLLLQPANADKVAAYAQKFAELPAPERTRIQNAAQDGHREVVQQLALEDALRYQKGKEPFDYQKEIANGVKAATDRVSYSEWQQGEKSGEGPKGGKKAVMAQARNIAEDMVRSRPDWATVYRRTGELPIGDEETDPSYMERVTAKLANEIYERMKVDTKYKVSPTGSGDQKKKESSDLFVRDITGDDLTAANSAANLLTGTTYAGNLKIENAWVNRIMDKDYSSSLSLVVTTPMSLAQVKQQVLDDNTGIAEEDVQVVEKQGNKEVTISFRPGAGGKQAAARLYDNFMKETGSVYEPKHTEREVKTAAGNTIITSPVQPSAPNKNAAPLDGMFK